MDIVVHVGASLIRNEENHVAIVARAVPSSAPQPQPLNKDALPPRINRQAGQKISRQAPGVVFSNHFQEIGNRKAWRELKTGRL